MKRRFSKRMLFALSVVAIGLTISAFIRFYHHFPHRLRIASTSVDAHGRYYHLPLDRVASCSLIEGRIVISGEVLVSLSEGRLESDRLSRGPPIPVTDIAGRSEQWVLESSSHDKHEFARRDSTQRLTIFSPPGAADLHCNIYDLQRGRTLIIFASGDWKVGPKSYYGYALIEPTA